MALLYALGGQPDRRGKQGERTHSKGQRILQSHQLRPPNFPQLLSNENLTKKPRGLFQSIF